MNDKQWVTQRFEEERPRLRGVAFRMLGTMADADDALQETWIRLDRADTTEVENLAGWLTTVVARVSLNMLRSRCRISLSPDMSFADRLGTDALPWRSAPVRHDAPSAGRSLAGPKSACDPAESALPMLQRGGETSRMAWFRRRVVFLPGLPPSASTRAIAGDADRLRDDGKRCAGRNARKTDTPFGRPEPPSCH